MKHKLVAPILSVMYPILAEQSHHSTDEDTADKAAAELLDTMALSLPKKHVFPPVFHFVSSNLKNSDWHYREAAMMALGVISEGCFEMMKGRIQEVLAMVLESLKDSEQIVRGAASFALGQFAEHLQPEISEHYETILPAIFSVLNDSSQDVQVSLSFAPDAGFRWSSTCTALVVCPY